MSTIARTESSDSKQHTKQHSFKKPATYLGYALLAPWVLYTASLAQEKFVPFATSDTSEFQMRVLLIVFTLSCAIALTLKRQDLFQWLFCRFRSLKQFDSRDENKHRRVFKAMMFQSSRATIKHILILWGLFLSIHLLIAGFVGFSLGWTFPGDISTYVVFGATVAVNLVTYGIFSYLRLRREHKRANDPYHGSI